MKITKYEHACLDIEVGGKRLLVDPGVFTSSLKDFNNVAGVVVTHMHKDHLDPEKLIAIVEQNPDVAIYTVQAASDALNGSVPVTVVTGGDHGTAGPFTFDFYGGKHAVIHSSIPQTDNVGVLVNKTLYYPGDSFSAPDQPVVVLAAPVSAPWMKLSEAMDFVTDIKPKFVFPTHNAILSEVGKGINNPLLQASTESAGAIYNPLRSGESLTV